MRAGGTLRQDEMDSFARVVDNRLHDQWMAQIQVCDKTPGRTSLPAQAPEIKQRIVFVAEEKGTNDIGQMVVIVWWMERRLPGEQEHGSIPELDPWAPMVAPGPQSGRADQSNVIFVIYALLHASLTDFAWSVIILIFEVCMVDCPKSWSGLLALGAARVLGIQDAGALVAFLRAAENLHQAEQDTIDEAVTMTALLQGLQRYYKLGQTAAAASSSSSSSASSSTAIPARGPKAKKAKTGVAATTAEADAASSMNLTRSRGRRRRR